MKNKFLFPLIFMISGAAVAGIALFAAQLGLDPSSGWGKTRITILIFGISLVIFAAILWRYLDQALNLLRKIRYTIENHPVVVGARKNHSIIYISGLIKKYWFTFPILLLVVLIYIWFISSGTWLNWVSPTHLYADLARGFLRGKLYLPIKVSSNLLASPDPYNSSIGLGLQGPLDVSYFAGKYYLYWGPVPALILVLFHPLISWRLGDLQLLFGFLIGVYIMQCLLAVVIWDRFFSDLPKYILWLSILLIGLASPATFMLDSSRGARIYEAAITGGQFFLISGFIAAITALGPPISRWRLAGAGILWALAIGSRLTLALPVGFMVLMVTGWIVWLNHWSLRKGIELLPLSVPLALGFAGLGWYNWARFGSVLESGYFYQMTAVPNFQENYSLLVNPVFIIQNLYNYFLHPFSFQTQFPFIFAEYGNIKAIFSSYPLPSIYFSQKITGLVFTVPFIVFAVIPAVNYFNNLLRRKKFQTLLDPEDNGHVLNWTILTLSGACLVMFVFLLSFFWASMRYLEDLMPALLILSMIGFWQGVQLLSNKPVRKRIYINTGIVLIIISIVVSTLVALSINNARFVIIHLLLPAK
jgi:hypothetical protein